MSPQSEPALEAQQTGMGEFSRITGVFVDPQKAFADIVARPRWVVPLVLMMVSSLILMVAFSQRVGWDRMIRHQIESNPRMAQMPPEQLEKSIEIATRFGPIGAYTGVLLGTPILYLIVAGVLLLILKSFMGAEVRFSQMFATVSYGFLPGLVSTALGLVVMFLKSPDDFDIKNPVGFNPGAYMDPRTTSKFLYSLATSLDLFAIWTVLLLAVGIKAAAGKRVSFGGALAAVVLPWGIIVLIRAALAGVAG